MGRKATFSFLPLCLLLFVASCSNEAEQQRKLKKDVLSWTASAEMIADARLKGYVPEGYSRLAISQCRKQVDALLVQFAGDQSALRDIPVLLQATAVAVSADDKPSASRALASLRLKRVDLQREIQEP